jgi:hypothetical protein
MPETSSILNFTATLLGESIGLNQALPRPSASHAPVMGQFSLAGVSQILA